ncbi:MAG: hypothetical protein AB2602_15260 [Candidatus Thiodiazotropha sp.]
MGTEYYKGESIEKSDIKGEIYLFKAAKNRHINAQYGLCVIYSNDQVSIYNPKQSFAWCAVSKHNGNKLAAARLLEVQGKILVSEGLDRLNQYQSVAQHYINRWEK